MQKILALIISIVLSNSFVSSQNNYEDLIKTIEKHKKIPKSLYNKLLKNQLNNIKKNDGSQFKGFNEYMLKDSSVISLNKFKNLTTIYIQENKKDFKLEYVYENKNKISKSILFQQFPIGKTLYYKKNKIYKIIDNDSLFKISPDNIILIINKLYSIDVSEINYIAYLNRNLSRVNFTIEIDRNLIRGPRYHILYDGNNSNQINLKGFYLEIDGNTGEIIIQQEHTYMIPSCGN